MEGIDENIMAQLSVEGYNEDMGAGMDADDMEAAMKALTGGGGLPGMGGGAAAAAELEEKAAAAASGRVTAGGPDGMGTVTLEEIKKWVEIYPCYINEALNPKQGRRLAKSKVVGCTNPFVNEIASSATNLGLRAVMEPYKRHPRDPFTMGRARVELYKPGTHEPVVASIPSKQKLLEEIARVLPEDPARKHNQQQIAMAKAEMERRQAAFAASRQGKAALQAQAHAAAKAQAAVGSPEAGGKKKKR